MKRPNWTRKSKKGNSIFWKLNSKDHSPPFKESIKAQLWGNKEDNYFFAELVHILPNASKRSASFKETQGTSVSLNIGYKVCKYLTDDCCRCVSFPT